jgi:septation ring formation regulator EzrA
VEGAKQALSDALAQEESAVEAAKKKLAEAEKALVKADQELAKAWYDLRIFKRYECPQKLAKLREAVMKSQLAVQRTIISNNARVSKKRIEIANREKLIEDYRNDLNGIRDDMHALVIRAQADGM